MNKLTILFFSLIFVCLSSPTNLHGCLGSSEIVISEKLENALKQFNEASDGKINHEGFIDLDRESFEVLTHPDNRGPLRKIYSLAKKLPELAKKSNYKKFETAFKKFDELGIVRLDKVPFVGKVARYIKTESETNLFGIVTRKTYRDAEEVIPFPYTDKPIFGPAYLEAHDWLTDVYSALAMSSGPEKEKIRQLLTGRYGIAPIETPY